MHCSLWSTGARATILVKGIFCRLMTSSQPLRSGIGTMATTVAPDIILTSSSRKLQRPAMVAELSSPPHPPPVMQCGVVWCGAVRGLCLLGGCGVIIMNNNNNKVVVASAAARGVSFIFGRFFGQKLENLDFCVVFVNKVMVRALFFIVFSYFLLVRFLRKSRKYHAFRL